MKLDLSLEVIILPWYYLKSSIYYICILTTHSRMIDILSFLFHPFLHESHYSMVGISPCFFWGKGWTLFIDNTHEERSLVPFWDFRIDCNIGKQIAWSCFALLFWISLASLTDGYQAVWLEPSRTFEKANKLQSQANCVRVPMDPQEMFAIILYIFCCQNNFQIWTLLSEQWHYW